MNWKARLLYFLHESLRGLFVRASIHTPSPFSCNYVQQTFIIIKVTAALFHKGKDKEEQPAYLKSQSREFRYPPVAVLAEPKWRQ